jgi:hypothetical protein
MTEDTKVEDGKTSLVDEFKEMLKKYEEGKKEREKYKKRYRTKKEKKYLARRKMAKMSRRLNRSKK